MSKHEKPQKSNPHRLTVRQHVLPLKSIARFADSDGTMCLSDIGRRMIRRAKPADDMFCAKRAWYERAETGHKKTIEDAFQALADAILDGAVVKIEGQDAVIVSDFYALWYMRARHRELDEQEIQLHGVIGINSYTKDEEEKLEKQGMIFARASGKVAARQINGVQLEVKVARYSRQIQASARWGILQAGEGEFIVPDMPFATIVPPTPTVCLATPGQSGFITRDNVAAINQAFAILAQKYYFTRKLAVCPF